MRIIHRDVSIEYMRITIVSVWVRRLVMLQQSIKTVCADIDGAHNKLRARSLGACGSSISLSVSLEPKDVWYYLCIRIRWTVCSAAIFARADIAHKQCWLNRKYTLPAVVVNWGIRPTGIRVHDVMPC